MTGRTHVPVPRALVALAVAALLAGGLAAAPRPAVAAPDATAGPALSPAAPSVRHTRAAAKTPVYRDPVGYRGVTDEPKLLPTIGKTITLSTEGTFPHAYVDEAGTSHIVWNEGRGDDADVVVYCRLKRAEKACDSRTELRWDKTYGAGDGPEFNVDDYGPRIVRIGDQLLVLSFRYPTNTVKPGDPAPSSGATVGWLSQDGGTTWSAAKELGDTRLGEVIVAGPDDDPVVINVGEDPYCAEPENLGQICVSSIRSAGYDRSQGALNFDGKTNYYPTVTTDGQSAVMAMSDSTATDGSTIRVRRWSGASPVTDPDNWTMSAPVAGAVPDLASGPAGIFMIHDANAYPNPLQLRQLTMNAGVPTASAPKKIAPRARYHQLAQDASGALHVLYTTDLAKGQELRLADTAPGSTDFGAAGVIVKGPDVGQLDLAMTTDGGGVALANRTGGVLDPGAIVATNIGSLAPTGDPGLGGLQGGGNVSCGAVNFGAFDLTAQAGCFLKGTGASKNVVVTRNPISLNGLEIVPTAGSSLVIDPAKLRIDTAGAAQVLLRNADATVELFNGEIHRDLAGLRPGDRLFEFSPDLFPTDVLGFPVSSGMPVQLTENGIRIPVDVSLPPELGAFTGHAELVGDIDTGLRLDSLDIKLGPIPLGVASLGAEVVWQADGSWQGDGYIKVPAGGSFNASIKFDQGDFVSADFDYAPVPPLVVGPFVYLTSVGGGLSLDPDIEVRMRATLGSPAPVDDVYPVKVKGNATMTFPKTGPAQFHLGGALDLFLVHVADGSFDFFTDGYAQFRGDTSIDLGPLHGGALVQGFVDGTTGQFGAELKGEVEVCVDLGPGTFCGGVAAAQAISSKGFAVCARINPPDPIGGVSAGIASSWDDFDAVTLANPALLTAEIISHLTLDCNADAYAIPPPRARPALVVAARGARARADGGSSFAIPAGLPSATLQIDGAGGVPAVDVLGPDGDVLLDAAGTAEGVRVATVPGADKTWVLLPAPVGGAYTVIPRAGSVAVANVQVAQGFTPASVSAKLRRTPGKVLRQGRIDYRVRGLESGQSVEFRERGAFGTRTVGTVRKTGAGTLRFKPAAARGGKRTVEAVLLHRGLVQRVVPVGSFKAPGASKAGKVTHLSVKHRGSRVKVSFKPSKHAARTEVEVIGNAGGHVLRMLPGARHKLVLDGFRWDKRVKVKVTAFSADGRPGKPVVVRR